MNFLFLLLLQNEWTDYIGEGAVFSLVLVMLGFILKMLPTWKEIRIEEMKVRLKSAESIGSLGNSLNQLGIVMNNVAIEQRKSTENVLILQRVSADESRNLTSAVDELLERMVLLEKNLKEKNLKEKNNVTKNSTV